ncbi:MAG TPA: serine protease [Ramlibacter sp.]|uniref:S1 family peptidase n=1 Tax=Ramlibacter sp. TaxID=1917967 RepID=UPI002B81DF85|nr:serine protease [Ramlibacter sp.]HVZ45100.1 serine protease [Ramlibacter sp.]
MSTTRIATYRGRQSLTGATAFFFERDGRLYAVTSRHVLHDPASGHFPDRVELTLHLDERNLTRTALFSVPLYADERAVWRQGVDSQGEVDVAVIELHPDAIGGEAAIRPFRPEHLRIPESGVAAGEPLLVVGFPLGFYDTVHHLPVVRHAIVSSAFGVRFQGQGYFLTDGRLHRGSSGSPVLMRRPADTGAMPWVLLGVHSSRMDVGTRDQEQDESLGLNCAWYADMLMTLTAIDASPNPAASGPRQAKATGRST